MLRIFLASTIAASFLLCPRAGAAALFNLTGSEHGFGDVVGPYLLAQSHAAKEKTYLLLDDRAEQVLKIFLEQPDGLKAAGQLEFVRAEVLPSLSDVNRIFETFAGARAGNPVKPGDHLPRGARTVITNQDLHSPFGRPEFPVDLRASGLGDAEGPAGHFHFSAAGLGKNRLGILNDPAVEAYLGKSAAEQKALAATRFAGSPVESLLKRKRHPEALLSFAYGIHNEVFDSPRWKPYPGQFKSYVKGLEKIARKEGKAVVLLSPNKEEILRQALGEKSGASLESAASFFARENLTRGRVHIVSTGNLSNSQFLALTAAADLPYMIEGDSALSAAVRLKKPFVMMKGPWGLFGIDGLSAALKEAGAAWASTMYPVKAKPGHDTPNFSRLDLAQNDGASFTRLSRNANELSHSLALIGALAEGNAEPEAVFRELKDPMLRYSWAEDQFTRGKISHEEKLRFQAGLERPGDLADLLQAKRPLAGATIPCAEGFSRLAPASVTK